MDASGHSRCHGSRPRRIAVYPSRDDRASHAYANTISTGIVEIALSGACSELFYATRTSQAESLV